MRGEAPYDVLQRIEIEPLARRAGKGVAVRLPEFIETPVYGHAQRQGIGGGVRGEDAETQGGVIGQRRVPRDEQILARHR